MSRQVNTFSLGDFHDDMRLLGLGEGREGLNWELGFACFCIGKTGFRSLGLEFESEKKAKMGMGLVFCCILVGSGN